MRRPLVAALLAAVAIVMVSLVGPAAPTAAQALEPIEIVGTDLSAFPTVRLAVAVSGEAADQGLSADDLTLTENGEEIPVEVEALSDEGIDIVLTIDVSGSMAGEPIAQAKDAALQFIDELPDNARVAVVAFGNSAEVRSGFTDDRAESRAAVEALDDGGETALYDAVAVSAEQIAGSGAARTAIVLLSDGGDTVSAGSLESAVSSLRGVDTDFYAVSLQSGEADEAALAALAEAAEGRVIAASDPDALAEAYVDLGQRISNQYALVFESTTADPTATFTVTVGSTGTSDAIEIALPQRSGTATPTTVAEQAAPPELLISEGDTDLLEQDWVMWLGAALVGIALAVVAVAVAPTTRPTIRGRRSLRSDAAPVEHQGTGERIVDSVRDAATRVTTAAVERSERTGAIDDALDRAGLVMRAGEFVALVIGVMIAAAVVLGLLMGPVGVALGIFVPMFGAPTFLRLLASRRNSKFADQLADTLLLMSGSLRSGFGIGQTIDSVAQEMDAPMGTEFQRALLEMRLGREVDDAMSSIARRMQNEDFEWVVDAIRINRQVGGDLSVILEQVSETIRARTRLRRQIAALTAEGKLSGIVLSALPVMMALVLWSTNPDYLRPLFSRTAGQLMLAFAIGLLVTGALWLKKLIDVEL